MAEPLKTTKEKEESARKRGTEITGDRKKIVGGPVFEDTAFPAPEDKDLLTDGDPFALDWEHTRKPGKAA